VTARGRVRIAVARTILVLGLAAVAWASLLPPDDIPSGVLGSDKAMHAIGYAGLGFLASAAALRPVVSVAVLVAFGLLLEIAQRMTGYRSFEWLDLAADALGAVLGVVVGHLAFRERGRTRG
jgi:VanZ family protein